MAIRTIAHSSEITIGMGEIKCSPLPGIFTSRGIGSCVVLFIYDIEQKLGGGAHVLLPKKLSTSNIKDLAMFACHAPTILVGKLLAVGANRNKLKCKMCGGANFYEHYESKQLFSQGKASAKAVRDALRYIGIPIVVEDCGGVLARRVQFDSSTTVMRVKYENNIERIF